MKSLAGLAFGLLLFLAATAAAAQNPDLSVILLAKPQSPNPGDRITFDGQVTNHGPGAIQLVAEIRLPAGLTPVSSSSNAGTLHSSHPTGALVSNVTLAAGATFTLSTSADLPLGVAPGTLLTGEAEVRPNTPDADPTNNRATATMTVAAAATVQSADLALTITDGSATMSQGGEAAYVLTVANNGPDTADATLSFTLPAALTLASLSSPGGWSCTSPAVGMTGTVACSTPALSPGASGQVTVATRLSASTALGTQIISTATVTSTTTDPSVANNSATDIDIVVAAPVAAVPTLTEWAMVLFSLLLAGGAALHLQRRRRAA